MSNKKQVVIFGTSPFAEIVDIYLTADSPYKVAAFTMHDQWGETKVGDNVSIAPFSFIGMSAVITKDTIEKGVYKGPKSAPELYNTDEMRGI